MFGYGVIVVRSEFGVAIVAGLRAKGYTLSGGASGSVGDCKHCYYGAHDDGGCAGAAGAE